MFYLLVSMIIMQKTHMFIQDLMVQNLLQMDNIQVMHL